MEEQKKLNAVQRLALARLVPADLFGVYSGKNGKCCCGCAGNHRYVAANREAAGLHRGYAVSDDEVNDRQVAKVLGLLKANVEEVQQDYDHFALVVGERLYVAYLKVAK